MSTFDAKSWIATDWLNLWEVASSQTPIERTLTLVALSLPGFDAQALAELSLGECNAALLQLREQCFGHALNSVTPCPHCNEKAEVQLDTQTLYQARLRNSATHQFEHNFQNDEFAGTFRLLNNADLTAVACIADLESARQSLAQRCLLTLTYQGQPIALEQLPNAIIVVLAEAILKADPLAEIRLQLQCPVCEQTWPVQLNITEFLWEEIKQKVNSLLNEIHQLAIAYGWEETAILALSEMRRKFYLARVNT